MGHNTRFKGRSKIFPGYKVKFILQTDIGVLNAQVTSGQDETKIGDPDGGKYITGRLRRWYEKHKELQEGDKVIIEAIEPKKKYKLSMEK